MRRHDELRWARGLLDGQAAGPPPSDRGTERLTDAWNGLDLPEPAAAPPGLAERVAALTRTESALLPGLALSPRWASVAAVLLVAAGAVGGAGLGAYALQEEPAAESTLESDGLELFSDDALLDDYLPDATAAAATAVPDAGSQP